MVKKLYVSLTVVLLWNAAVFAGLLGSDVLVKCYPSDNLSINLFNSDFNPEFASATVIEPGIEFYYWEDYEDDPDYLALNFAANTFTISVHKGSFASGFMNELSFEIIDLDFGDAITGLVVLQNNFPTIPSFSHTSSSISVTTPSGPIPSDFTHSIQFEIVPEPATLLLLTLGGLFLRRRT